MQRLEVSGAVRPIYGSLGVKRLIYACEMHNEILRSLKLLVDPGLCSDIF